MNASQIRLSLILVFPGLCLAQSSVQPALQQASSPTPMIWNQIPAPDQSQAIPLGTTSPSTRQSEEWVLFQEKRCVYNVSIATLLPVLPERTKSTGAAVIVAPGGAFLYLEYDKEGIDEARWLADHGIAAFVLKYRTHEVPRDPRAAQQAVLDLVRTMTSDPNNKRPAPTTPQAALDDAKAAVQLVRSRAEEWGIDPSRVGFMGFSAGAATALSVGLTDEKRARPNFIAPVYGPMNPVGVPVDAPPIFLAIAADDQLMVRGEGALGLIDSWRRAGRPLEAHIYLRGGHGFGMNHVSASTSLWIDEFYAWMKDIRMLDKPQ